MCASEFYCTFSDTVFIPRRTEGDMIENVYWSSRAGYSCPILMTLEFSGEIFEKKYSNITLL
jgi:hypothetical protein